METPVTVPASLPVEFPAVTVGGKQYQLRFAHSAWYMLQKWGFTIGDPKNPIPIAAMAAASVGTVDKSGKWKSAPFATPIEMLDAMEPGETLPSLEQPVLDALKKAAPDANLTVAEPPATEPSDPTT